MRLPQPLLDSPFFLFERLDDLIRALGSDLDPLEEMEIRRLAQLGLPPVTSITTLATMLGLNPGFVWSLVHTNRRYYRSFALPKGRGFREITAPKVGLKIVQKWVSVHLNRRYQPAEHVHGFVTGKSHVTAAECHVGAEWVASFDIRDFFPSTPQILVETVLMESGYSQEAARILGSICCYKGFLPQGAPSSPVLANMCFSSVDAGISELANDLELVVTRYADDVTYSSRGEWNLQIEQRMRELLDASPWSLAVQKTCYARLPERLKVHGLLVSGDKVRLTKGYRNRLRMLRHLKARGVDLGVETSKINGHIEYAKFIDERA